MCYLKLFCPFFWQLIYVGCVDLRELKTNPSTIPVCVLEVLSSSTKNGKSFVLIPFAITVLIRCFWFKQCEMSSKVSYLHISLLIDLNWNAILEVTFYDETWFIMTKVTLFLAYCECNKIQKMSFEQLTTLNLMSCSNNSRSPTKGWVSNGKKWDSVKLKTTCNVRRGSKLWSDKGIAVHY